MFLCVLSKEQKVCAKTRCSKPFSYDEDCKKIVQILLSVPEYTNIYSAHTFKQATIIFMDNGSPLLLQHVC
jgi:hypothetical protein